MIATVAPQGRAALLRRGIALEAAHETIVCAWLSLATLLGLALNAALGWWWADPVAALAMLPLIVREGLESYAEGSGSR